jgi:hypothetical protein
MYGEEKKNAYRMVGKPERRRLLLILLAASGSVVG